MKVRKIRTGTEAGTGWERERGRGWRPVDEDRMGTGTGAGGEVRESSSGDGNRGEDGKNGDGNESRIGEGGGEVKKRKKPHKRVVDAFRYFHSARVIISADKGWRLRAPDSSVRKVQCLYTRIAPTG